MSIWAIVPAAGIGRRMASITPKQVAKQYREVAGQPVLAHSLKKLLTLPALTQVVVVLHPEDTHFSTLDVAADPRITTVSGGAERQDSVRNGLAALGAAQPDDWVLVHDAVRPCVSHEDLLKLLQELQEHPVGGLLAAPVDNTLKAANAVQQVQQTVDRSALWQAFTPQMFRYGQLTTALQQAREQQLAITDEASAIEACGLQPQLVLGSKLNLKITHESDLQLAELILQQQLAAVSNEGSA